jgi:hypothetical protein
MQYGLRAAALKDGLGLLIQGKKSQKSRKPHTESYRSNTLPLCLQIAKITEIDKRELLKRGGITSASII